MDFEAEVNKEKVIPRRVAGDINDLFYLLIQAKPKPYQM